MRKTQFAKSNNDDKDKPISKLFENLLTAEELATALRGHYTRDSIYTMRSRDGMPAHKIRGRLYFRLDEVEAWLTSK